MSIFSKVKNKIRSISAKQAVIASVFVLAVSGAAGLGLAAKQNANALYRDYSGNAMMKGGAADGKEYVKKLKNNSKYANEAAKFHKSYKLSRSDYGRFADDAQQCYAYKKSDTVKCKINGKWRTVLSDAWSIGRDKKSNSWVHMIDGKKYYADHNSKVFLSDKLDVMVMFNSKGEVQYAALNSCGNQMGGKKTKVSIKCDRLSKKKVGKDKYEFTTKVSHSSLASIEKVVYYANSSKIGESKSKSSGYKITKTFTKSTTVTAKVYFKVPGKHTRVVSSTLCQTKITVTPPPKEEPKNPAMEVAKDVRLSNDDEWSQEVTADPGDELQYRIVVTNTGDVTLKNVVVTDSLPGGVSFTADNLEGSAEVTGFTISDLVGGGINIGDIPVGQSREIKFSVTVDEDTDACEEKLRNVARADADNVPEDEDDALAKVCQPETPEQPEEPEEEVLGKETPEALPKTGAASIAGIFFSATGAGAAAHRLIMRRLQK